MKRWPFAAAEEELVALFQDPGFVAAQRYDADRGGGEWDVSGVRLVALLDDREHARRERRDTYVATLRACDDATQRRLAQAYAPRRRGGERLAAAFNGHTREGVRRLNLLPLCESAARAWDDVNRRDIERIQKELRKTTIKGDAANVLWTQLSTLTARAECKPSSQELYAFFDGVALGDAVAKKNESGRVRKCRNRDCAEKIRIELRVCPSCGTTQPVDPRISAVEREADALLAGEDPDELVKKYFQTTHRDGQTWTGERPPPLLVYEIHRRRRVVAAAQAKEEHLLAIREGRA